MIDRLTLRTSVSTTGRGLMIAVVVMFLILCGVPAHAQFTFQDINPDTSNLDSSDPDGATGGRVNGLATVAGSNQIFYAASEWGGIYKTYDGGVTWSRLHGHNPNGAWDVEVNPGLVNRVYATSKYDGRTNSIAGINVSFNSGTTWTHVDWPPPGTNCAFNNVDDEISAFGIAVDPDDTNDVYIGTNCGLAYSTDGGTSWAIRQPDPGRENDWIMDVVVHHSGIIDICGLRGHQRSTDGGSTWSAPSADLPGGFCSIAASPDESGVLFVTVGADIYESDDGGVSWTNLGTPDKARQGAFRSSPPTSGRMTTSTCGMAISACTAASAPAMSRGCGVPRPATIRPSHRLRDGRARSRARWAAMTTSATSSSTSPRRTTPARRSSRPTAACTTTPTQGTAATTRTGSSRRSHPTACGCGR
jgi:hypothetical protein